MKLNGQIVPNAPVTELTVNHTDMRYTSVPESIVTLNWNTGSPLPSPLPSELKVLNCNYVTELPVLPAGLESLHCDLVKVLPYTLPKRLKELSCKSVTLIIKDLPNSIAKLWVDSVPFLDFRLPNSLELLSARSAGALPVFTPKKLKTVFCGILQEPLDYLADLTYGVYCRNDIKSKLDHTL